MGTWHQPTQATYRRALEATYRRELDLGAILDAFESAGLIVRAPYYVPDVDELYQMRHWLLERRTPINREYRWVMCRETIDALAEQHHNHRAPAPIQFDAGFWMGEGAELPSAALDEMEVVTMIESRRRWSQTDRLFGVDIRVDPAARSPLFEIDTPGTLAPR